MARLPSRTDLSGPDSFRSGRVQSSVDTSAIGRGLQSLGNDITAFGRERQQQQNAVDVARAEALKTEGLLGVQNEFANDPDYATYGKRAPEKTGGVIKSIAGIIRDPQMRERWLAGAQADAARVNDGIFDQGRATGRAAEVIAFDNALETNRRIYVDPASPPEAKAKAKADIEGSIQMGQETGLLDPVDAETRRENYIRKATVSGLMLDAEANPGRYLPPANAANLPAGMRNNNPGNIKFVGQGANRGVVGPSQNTDQGDPQAVFATPEAGMAEAYRLALSKYNGGKTTANDLIAADGGWTPGNYKAAENIAKSMGLSPSDDLNLKDPAQAAKFMRGLVRQEHGPASDAYSDAMIRDAVTGKVQPSAPVNVPDVTQANSFLKTRLIGHSGDHVDNLQPEMQQRLAALLQGAPPAIAGKLGIYSGARSIARQKELWDAALVKYGSAEAARKWVAPPGKSNHNAGAAADLSYDGKSLKNAPPEVVKWLHDNAANYGLKFPLGNENWHVELASTRGGAQQAIPDWAKDISPEDRYRIQQAAQTRQNQLGVETRGQINTVVQNAPAAIQNTGVYSGQLPTQEQFVAAYGPQDGQERYDKFQAQIEVSQQSYDFRTMSSGDIQEAVKQAMPTSSGNDAAIQTGKYQILQNAAEATLKARNADPAGYTQQVFPSVAQAWEEAQTSGDYQTAMAQTAAAQQQLGIANMQLLPAPVADQSVAKFKDEATPSQDRVNAVAGLVFSTADPTQRQAVFDQLVKAGLPDITAGALRATARGNAGASRRLFEAAMVDVSKLPGKTPDEAKPALIDEAIQTQLMDSGQIGDVYYGLSHGSTDNLQTAQRDSKLMVNAVTLRVRNGETLDAAVNGVAKDLFGDVKPITGDNYQILVPSDADEGAVINGLERQLPTVKAALEAAYLTSFTGVPGGEAIANAARDNNVARVMTQGYFRNAGDGYAFIDPFTDTAVPGEDGQPLIVMPKDIEQAAPGAAFEMRTPTTGAGPSLDENGNPVVLGR